MSTELLEQTTTQQPVPTSPEETQLVYNADTDQVIESYRVVGKKRYRVRHIFAPISDDIQLEFFKRARLVMEREVNGESDITLDNDSIAAAIYLHDATAKTIEGVNLEGVQDWKSTVVSIQSKQDFVNECLIYCEVFPAADDSDIEEEATDQSDIIDATEGELCPVEISPTLNQFKYAAIVRFNGKEIRTTHIMRAATGAEMMRYARVNQRSAMRPGVKGRIKTVIPSKAADFAAFYDAMVENESVTGFAGRVPLFVKKTVAETHMAEEEKRLRGN